MQDSQPIWVVDDDEDDQFLIGIALQEIIPLRSIKFLSNGEELLMGLAQTTHPPKLVLLDLRLTYQTGLDILQTLRTLPAYQHLSVVMLTTCLTPDEEHRAYQLGAQAIFIKENGFLDVVEMIRPLL
ncbi:response regulator [Spirosoma sp.]|uniref:response regulator n=1 Tax=Spirosoma sp. TaxID=1899569 RepID=UPI002605A359|nr:response regulator [Spirosoma sp.]MCX6212876.1 response regulator [Spirosoma sp.]